MGYVLQFGEIAYMKEYSIIISARFGWSLMSEPNMHRGDFFGKLVFTADTEVFTDPNWHSCKRTLA